MVVGVIVFVLYVVSNNTKITQEESSALQKDSSIASTTHSTSFISEARVTKVVDGDTVVLEDGTRVRVVGIDTPETVDPRKAVQCFGKEASNRMKEIVAGKNIIFTKSVIGDSIDKYGRRLYYLSLDNVDIGAKMIEDGYAYAYTSYPHDRTDAYKLLQQKAKVAKRGLWSDSTCSGNANTNTSQPTL